MFEKIPPEVSGAAMAIIMSVLRILYDSKSKSVRPARIALEALICGAMTLTAGSAVKAIGLDSNWILFGGGVIGYLGPVTVRAMTLKYLTKKAEEGDS